MKLRKITDRKFDMTMLYEFVMLVAIIVIVSLLVFSMNEDARTDIIEEDRATATVTNETLTTVTEAGEAFSKSTLRDVTCSVTAVVNSIDGVTIASTNYTATNCNIAWSGGDGDGFNNTNWKVSYTAEYSEDSTRYNATINNDTAVAKIPTSLKLLATAIVFGAVLFVILKVIPMNGVKSDLQ